jgi:hypothetical protein
MAHKVEYLPSKHGALSSITSTAKKKKKKAQDRISADYRLGSSKGLPLDRKIEKQAKTVRTSLDRTLDNSQRFIVKPSTTPQKMQENLCDIFTCP